MAEDDELTAGSKIDTYRDTDVVLLVGKKRFYCNRNLLAKKSSYFAAMFNSNMIESNSDIVNLQNVCPSAMEILLTYIKTDRFNITNDNVTKVLQAAAMLQFVEIEKACIEMLLESLNISNCLGMLFLADSLMIQDLLVKAKQLALWDFDQVQQYSEILDLPVENLSEYLSNDALRTKSELQVFSVLVRWIVHDKSNRLEHFKELLSTVRFSEATTKEIKQMARNELVKECSDIRRLISTVWRTKFEKQLNERSNNGSRCTSAQSTPLSDLSPAESIEVLNEAAAVVFIKKDDADSNETVKLEYETSEEKDEEETPPGTKTEEGDESDDKHVNLSTVDQLSDKVLALRLLSSAPRSIFMVPSVVGRATEREDEENSSNLGFITYDTNKRKLSHIASAKKAFENNHVAVGIKACAVGNMIYVIGGEFLFGHSNWNQTVWKYNVFSKVWSFVITMPTPRRHHSLCVMGDDIYVIGGIGRFRLALDSVDMLCTYPAYWSNLPPMPNSVYSATSASYEGKIYVLETNVYRYDPHHSLWTHLKAYRLPNEIGFHSALPHSNGIYLIGNCSSDLVLFSVKENERLKDGKPTQVVGRFEHPSENACIVGDKIYSFSSCKRTIVQSYDITTDRFSIEYESNNNHEHSFSATIHYGCFPLPKYDV